MNIKGKIEKIGSRQGKTQFGKSYTLYEIYINGKKYTFFNEQFLNGLDVGDYVEVSLEKKGLYNEVQNIVKITKEEAEKAAENEPKNKTAYEINELLKLILAELKELNQTTKTTWVKVQDGKP